MANILNAHLIANPFTPATNDYYASVISNGNINSDGLIDLIIADGIEISASTLKNAVTRYNEKAAEMALSGTNVDTGLVYLRPVIKGIFFDKTWNPETNPVVVNATQGAALRKAAADTTVNILGTKANLIELFSITDLTTQQTDGTVTRGRNTELRGAYIKIMGDHPSVGIAFKNLTSGEVFKLPITEVVLNEPSRLLLLIPSNAPAGEYELTVTTQCGTGNKLLKVPRSATLPMPVVII